MANMSYCRFQNTVGDMEDCIEAIECNEVSDLSDDEQSAYEEFIEKCVQVACDHGYVIDQDCILASDA